MTLLRRLAAWLGLAARGRATRVAVVEECEARILYSADLNPALWAGDVSAQPSAIVGAVNPATAVSTHEASAREAQAQQVQRRHEIVFVDAAVPDAQTLIDGILAQRGAEVDIEVVQLRSDANGLQQISDVLAGERHLDTVHIVSHGEAGRLWLGSGLVDARALQQHGSFDAWKSALNGDADVLLWGCKVAEGAQGEAFVAQFAAATGADVAASTNDSGSAARSADWTLEFASGGVLPNNTLADAGWDGVLFTFTVTNVNDSGAGSLRQAIIDANANAGADIITFNIATTGVHTIAPTSALPTITGQVTIDASTDDSFAANGNRPAIILEGTNAGAGTEGLVLTSTADGSVIRGLVIRDFGGDGIVIEAGSDNNVIAGNYIGRLTTSGTDAGAGTENAGTGIDVRGSNNTIGGTLAADRNVISGNAQSGINLEDAGASGNTVAGNYIGLTAAGTAVLGNVNDGVLIRNGASGNTIGGATPAHRNVIAGNGDDGVQFSANVLSNDNNVVSGNYIGTDFTGTVDLGNAGDGVDFDDTALNNQILNNLIAGNSSDGIDLAGAGTPTGTIIRGNLIGTAANGSSALGNSGHGIRIGTSGTAYNTTIGGTTGGQGNTIAFNARDGIFVDVTSTSVAILGNSIYGNTEQGVDLGAGGVTANDTGDADTGANDLQNYPVLTSANADAAGTTIVGTINSTANTSLRIESFANRPSIADTPNGEGERYLGFITVITDSSGNASVNTVLSNVWINSGDRITATATNLTTNDTSEFAANVTATSTGIIVVDTTSDVSDGTTTSIFNLGNNRGADGRISLREAINAANATPNGGTPDKIVFNIPLTDANHLYYRDNAVAGTFSAAVATTRADSAISDFDADYAAGTARSWYRITLGTTNLDVTQAVIIDGSTQPGYDATKGPVIEINAAAVTGADANAIALTTGASTIRGLVINRAGDNAIEVDTGAASSVIVGNYIGTDVSGTQALGNSTVGSWGAIAIKTNNVVVGGTTAADRNLISGNGGSGIELYNAATGALIRGNYIGTTVTGVSALGNAAAGVDIRNNSANNTVGGVAADQGNTIAFNGGDGVSIVTAISGNVVRGNSIHSNTGLAIDLNNDGVTLNDAADGDAGPNALKNFPVVTLVTTGGGTVTVSGTLNTTANATHTIDFYSSPSADGTGFGEGATYVGSTVVTTDGSGNASFSDISFAQAVPVGHVVTAVTVDLASGNTSEFSRSAVAISSLQATITVDTTSDASDGDTTSLSTLLANKGADGFVSLREAIIAANNTANGSSADRIVFNIAGASVHTITVGATALPTITQALIIDGWSEPDYAGTPVIELNGNYAGASNEGLTLGAGSSGSTVRGLIINRFTGNGIEINGSNNQTIEGNWIGLNAAGTAASANVENGLYATLSSGNLIGGTSAAARNVVSGNGYRGIYFVDVDSSTVAGNYVGTDLAGTADVNGAGVNLNQSGIVLAAGSSGNVVGGASSATRNVIAGNNHYGLEIQSAASQNNLVQGNYIGTTYTGLAALGNISGGMSFWGSGSGNLLGGGVAEARNVIAGNLGVGVLVSNASSGATVQGNYIGLAADGSTALGNGTDGVAIEGASINTLIGTDLNGSNDAGERNVISGNAALGIEIRQAGTTGTIVRGNYIGTNAAGSAARGNVQNGIGIYNGASGSTVGGTAAGAGNLLSGNGDNGISIADIGTTGNLMLGNIIGLNATQTATLGNTNQGIWIGGGASGNTVGGTAVGSANIIGGNTYAGIELHGAGTTNNTVAGNIIGSDATGTVNFGNGAGVAVVFGATDNLIGGTAAQAGNLITHSGGAGVVIYTASAGNAVLGNSIRGNGGLGIDLGADGFTANDTGDVDGGANNLQNFAVLTLARTNGANQLTLDGTLNSSANSYYRIEFFANTAQDGSGYGEGQTYLGFVNVATDGSGNGAISTTLVVNVAAGTFISATATKSDSGYSAYTDTSEFARNIYALPTVQAALVVDTTNDVVDGDATSISTLLANKGADGFISLREAIIAANNTANGSSSDSITFNIPGVGPQAINLMSALPTITDAVVLDATTQTGYVAGSPVIVLDGVGAGAEASGFVLRASNSTITGFRIQNFFNGTTSTSGTGIVIDGTAGGGDNNTISHNYLNNNGESVTGAVGAITIAGAADNSLITNNQLINNNSDGIRFADALSSGTQITNNVIDGSGDDGVKLVGANITFTGNTVSNSQRLTVGAAGVELETVTGTSVVSNNTITNDGTRGTEGGVSVRGSAGVTVGSNTLNGWGGSGIVIDNASSGIRLTQNAIASNGLLGIDLAADDLNAANDVGDGDSGPNNLQNFPVLAAAITNGAQITITCSFNSLASTTFRIEFFASTAADSSGYGEGQNYLGFADVTTDGSGNATITTTLSGSVAAGAFISATAINSTTNDTSEFAQCAVATLANAAPTLSATALNPAFTEAAGVGTQAAAVAVFSGAVASTVETGQTITGLTFSVGGLLDGASEVIVVDGRTITLGATSSGTTLTNGLAYSATVSGGTATVVLSGGTLSTAATQALVNGVTYQNTNIDNPTAGNRVITLTQIRDSGGTIDGGVDTTALLIGSTVAVAAVNDAPTGAPVVTGTATENEVLSANTGTIADAEGLGVFGYQWQRNGVNVAGATASTYTLGDADVGANIRVLVSYADGGGTAESLASAAVGPVANVNDAPTGAPNITGTATEDQVLTANTGTVADADGLGAFSYQWQRNGANIAAATASTYTLGDVDVGTNIGVVVSYTDGAGTAESLTSAAVGPVANVNDAPIAADDRLALNFDGVDDYVTIANSPSLVMSSSATLEAWINPDLSSNAVQIIANKEGEYELAVFADGSLNFAFAEGGAWNWHNTGATIARNTWTHIAVTYNAGAVSTYVGGVLVDSQTLATTTIDDVYPALNELRIGGRSNSPANQYFDGRIAEMRVWSVVRSPAQIAGAMNGPLTGAEAGLAGYWALNENSGTTVTDGTANGNTGTLVNGVTWAGYRIDEDTTLTAVVPGVLANDYDADGNPLTAVLVSGPAHGSLTLNANGSFVYTPTANWHGTDSFTYKANDGTADSNIATVSVVVDPVSDAPTGAAVVTGTPTEDQVLSAGTGTIADGDGLGAFSYQWQRDGVNIAGATASTFTLGDIDVGTNIRVIVSYTDGDGTAESLTSAAVGPVANTNDAPTGAPVVTGTTTEDQVLTANTGTIADADGLGAFSYQWQRNGVNVVGATAATYTLGDADVGANVRVIVSYTDGNGTAESLTSAAVGPIANVNDAPTGAPVVTGTPTEDQVLTANTATVADTDGLGAFSYQWQRNGVNIGGATSSTYALGDADVGANIRVIVGYTDGNGAAESLTSAAIGPIANVNDAPTGAPVVTGTTTEDQVLTADVSSIADADGIGAFTYQWQRNGANIAGATGSTYTLGDADVGANIRVVVSYTDGNGTADSLTSAAVGPIANVNDAPTGAPVVTGTTTEDQTLTANTTAIADADGLGAFGYQWQRNGANIAGATASTYALGDADVGTNIRVVVSYNDGNGTGESLISAAVGPVANVNDSPTGTLVVTGTTTEDQVLTADTGSIVDADGQGTYSYQWQRNGANIAGATGSTYTLGDADVGANIRVVVSYNDGNGTAESLTSAAVGPVANVNDAPSGAPVVTGTTTEDQTLTANTTAIADADGLGAFSYQWQRNGANIAGATASTYTLGDADVGANIRVIVSYNDGNGTAESLTSAAVGPVANVNDAPSGAPVVTGTTTEDQTLTANTTAIADADGLGAFGYQWQRNGANIAGATASTYTLGDADVGANIRVVVSYTDGNGTAESLTSAAVGPVTNVNDAPSGAPVVTGTTTEDQTLTANTTAIADADGLGAFGYQWQRNGADIVGAASGSYTLGDADVGANIRVVVSYTDGNGTAESLTSAAVGPIANANDAPSGAPVVTGTTTEDQVLTADTTSIADADGLGAFSYQWQRNGANIVGAMGSTFTLGDTDVGANICVIVSYTDGNGTAESLTSVAVGPVANINDAPSGAPVVTGTTTEDQTLTADSSAIADTDGLGVLSYQWQRNGASIVGATAATYTLGDADVGANIRVIVAYTDGSGTAESLTSAAVGPVANVNDAPTGAPVVTGTATEDQILTADTSSIADADGIGAFTYQWQRNGANVVGATSGTFTLGDADVGANIRVIASYTDGNGTAESLISAAVGPVANVNDAPSGAPLITGTVTEDQVLTADTSTITDADGVGALAYQWQRNGANIAGAISGNYTLGDADVGTNVRVIVSYTDGNGTAESLISAAVGPVVNVNDAPSGAPLVTGTTAEDQTVTADTGTIADADGLGAFSYQWQRNGASIVGATAATYTLDDIDVGTNIRVVVSYTDGNGTAESLTSAAVGPIANVNDAPAITSNGGAALASLNGSENVAAVTTLTSTDSDGGPPAYSIVGGADAARFMIDSASGALSFVAAPDFEAPLDADADNVYDVTVQVSDGLAADTQALSITIAGVNEAPTGITPLTAAIDESAAAGTLVVSVRAVDADAGDLFSFSLVSDAAGRFAIDAASGRIVVAPGALLDFETQSSIDLLVRVTDAAGLSIERSFTVALRDVAEGAGPGVPQPPAVTPPEPVAPAPTPAGSPRDNGASAAAPAAAPRSAGATLPAELQGDKVLASADAARGGIDLRTARPEAPPWTTLREREGVDALVVTVDLNGFDDGGGPSAPISAALRQVSFALRNAGIEAQTADIGAVDERRTPSTLLAIAQDPVRVASLGFTAGFVWWLTRSGGLLTSMLMGVPAWRHLDLLPVVARRRNDDDEDDLALDSELDSRAADDVEDSALLDLFEAQPIPHQARSSL